MHADKIIILDSNEENTRFFTDHWLSDDYDVEVVRNLEDMAERVTENDFKLVMVDYLTIVDAERSDVINMFGILNDHHLAVYHVPDKANRRLAFYDLGALRVYDDALSLTEVYFSLKCFLSSMSSGQNQRDYYSAGKLEDVPLATLIKIFGKENRTGVLKIITRFNSGKIYFIDGDMDDAQVGFHQADKAILHMLFWKTGSFTFNATEADTPSNEVRLSNVGILLLAERLRREYIVNLEEIGPSSCVIRARNVGDLLTSENNLHEDFVRYLERPHTLEEIIENAFYTSFETAVILVRLKRQNFLHLSEPNKLSLNELPEQVEQVEQGAPDVEKIKLTMDEMADLRTTLQLENLESGKIIVLGSQDSGKAQFVQTISNSKQAVKNEQGLDLGHLLIHPNIDIFILGLMISEKAIETVQKLSEGVSGYIFLINDQKEDLFEYTNYLVNHLTGRNDVPWTIAITNMDDVDRIEDVKRAFHFTFPAEWIQCDTTDLDSIKTVLLSMRIPEPVEEEKTEEGETEEEEKEKSEQSGQEDHATNEAIHTAEPETEDTEKQDESGL